MPAAIEKAKPVALLIFGSAAVTALCGTLLVALSTVVRGVAPREDLVFYFFWLPFKMTGFAFLFHAMLFAIIVALGGALNWRRRGELARTYAIVVVTLVALVMLLQLYTGSFGDGSLGGFVINVLIFGCPFVVALALQRQSPTPA